MRHCRACVVLFLSAWGVAAFAQAEPFYQSHFPPEEFRARWAKIFEKIGPSAVAIVQGMPQVNGFILPRQTTRRTAMRFLSPRMLYGVRPWECCRDDAFWIFRPKMVHQRQRRVVWAASGGLRSTMEPTT